MRTRSLLLGLLALAPLPALATMLDREFTEQVFIDGGLEQLTALAWAPDGSNRLFVTRKEGEIRVVKDGELQPTPWATVSPLRTSVESGLVGLAFDPNFAANGYVYVFATVSETEQQLLRYTDVNGVGTNKTVILGGLPTRGLNHNGGGMAFGPDGHLYFGIGDSGSYTGTNEDLSSLSSKIGRTRTDGTAPQDNPFFDGPGPHNDYIWARGFRNPFGLAFQPGTGKLWVNVAGDHFEQIFAAQAGDHAGWSRYERNQPSGFLAPVIKYPTGGAESFWMSIVSAERRNNVATFTLSGPHYLRPGERIILSWVSDRSFWGEADIASVPTPDSFTVFQPGPDVKSINGGFETRELGGSVTGGAFHGGAGLPPEYRGNFFFGDFISDRIIRATIAADGQVKRVAPWASNIHGAVGVAVGPDNAIYYAEFYSGRIYRAAFTPRQPRVLVSKADLTLEEGATTSFTVRLDKAPTAPVQVSVSIYNQGTEVSVAEGEQMTFTPANYDTPQAVTLTAGDDTDTLHESLAFFTGGFNVEARELNVRIFDDDGVDLVLSQTEVRMQEGLENWVMVSLARPPPANVSVVATRVEGDGVEVAPGTLLSFTPTNYQTPQRLILQAVEDFDSWDNEATLHVTGAGLRMRPVTVRVNDNDPMGPIFTSAPVATALEGQPYRYEVRTEAGPAPLFALANPPEGMLIDPDTGVITWTTATPGTYEVSVRATNGRIPDGLQSFTLTVLPYSLDGGTSDGGIADGGSHPSDGGTAQDGGAEQPQPDAGGVIPPDSDSRCGCTAGQPAGVILLGSALLSLLSQRRRPELE